MNISIEEKKLLLDVAKKTIISYFTGEKITKPEFPKDSVLNSHAGAFVTLTKHKKLRGCIGYIISDQPLYDTVCDAAIQASQSDPRFPVVELSEVKNLSLEISVLSEPFPLNSYDEIEIGKHGLILEERGRRGLLLPQVPIEHHMNKEQYLDAICQKAGFYPGYWRQKQLELKAFTATVFSEGELESRVEEKM